MKEDGPKAGYLIGYRIVMGHFRPPSNKGPPTEGLSERAYLGHFVYKVNQVAAVVASKVCNFLLLEDIRLADDLS